MRERREQRKRNAQVSPLDVIAAHCQTLPGDPQQSDRLTYSCGNEKIGGPDADRILAEVEADESILQLRSQFQNCRRIVLESRGKPVSAAIIELHVANGVLEVPILAAARNVRQSGYGSLLVALIMELAATQLNATMLLISATSESRRFWLRQGLHTISQCPQNVAATIRAIAQRGECFGFFQTTKMACELPPEAFSAGSLIAETRVRNKSRSSSSSKNYSAARAAAMVGYSNVAPGCSFVTSEDGETKQQIACDDSEQRTLAISSSKVVAFQKETEDGDETLQKPTQSSDWGEAGWGVRCLGSIEKGDAIMEICGEYVTDEQYLKLKDRRLVVGFDERARRVKLAAGDPLNWVNLCSNASLARLVNICHEAPNLELQVYPETSLVRGASPPRRFFLVARHSIPPLTELFWEGPGRRRGAIGLRPGVNAGSETMVLPKPKELEVRQSSEGLFGARYVASIVLGDVDSGEAFRVRYNALWASIHGNDPLEEWIWPTVSDEARPLPPQTPPNFHDSLVDGDRAELSLEGGWWPVTVKRLQSGIWQAESAIDISRFSGLSVELRRLSAKTRLRPEWRWKADDATWRYNSGDVAYICDVEGKVLKCLRRCK